MKTQHHNSSSLLLIAILIGSGFSFISATQLHAQKAETAPPGVDPATHAAHVAAGTMPDAAPDAASDDPALAQQIAQLMAKVTQLETTLAKSVTPAGAVMPGMSGGAAPAPAMTGMSTAAAAAASPTMAGMSGGAAPAAGGMSMMGMMDKMMGMMDKMMGMGGGAMSTDAPMPAGGMGMMDMGKMKMGGGAMPSTPAAPMAGGGMGMMDMDNKMEMAGKMGMGTMAGAAPGAMPQSALPGFPGASHLYHLGATGFFLDHTQHIALTTEQQAGLNKAKEQALLAKSTADRAKEQAEQELWMLTAADQPDAALIEAKLAEISMITANERLGFIRAVGEASELLTDEQRKILTGFAPPAPATAPMKGM